MTGIIEFCVRWFQRGLIRTCLLQTTLEVVHARMLAILITAACLRLEPGEISSRRGALLSFNAEVYCN